MLDQSTLKSLFQKKISYLTLTINIRGFAQSTASIDEIFFSHIFNTFTNLIELNLNENSINCRPILSLHGLSSVVCYSTSLVDLRISVDNFDDCLCSFDGRFPQLRKLSVVICKIDPPSLSIANSVRIDLSSGISSYCFGNIDAENIVSNEILFLIFVPQHRSI